jgi:hypothetical protein
MQIRIAFQGFIIFDAGLRRRRAFRYADFMVTGQTAMGLVIAGLCAIGLWHSRWLLVNTRKGMMLVRWRGKTGGLRFLRGLLLVGLIFGILLALDVIRPIHWAK